MKVNREVYEVHTCMKERRYRGRVGIEVMGEVCRSAEVNGQVWVTAVMKVQRS